MSPRTALNKDLIMRRVTERYPTQPQTAPTTCPTTTTDSDVTLRFPLERLGHVPYRCPILADAPLFPRQAMDKRPRSPTYSLSSNPDIASFES